jgi:hypothetical protein
MHMSVRASPPSDADHRNGRAVVFFRQIETLLLEEMTATPEMQKEMRFADKLCAIDIAIKNATNLALQGLVSDD